METPIVIILEPECEMITLMLYEELTHIFAVRLKDKKDKVTEKFIEWDTILDELKEGRLKEWLDQFRSANKFDLERLDKECLSVFQLLEFIDKKGSWGFESGESYLPDAVEIFLDKLAAALVKNILDEYGELHWNTWAEFIEILKKMIISIGKRKNNSSFRKLEIKCIGYADYEDFSEQPKQERENVQKQNLCIYYDKPNCEHDKIRDKNNIKYFVLDKKYPFPQINIVDNNCKLSAVRAYRAVSHLFDKILEFSDNRHKVPIECSYAAGGKLDFPKNKKKKSSQKGEPKDRRIEIKIRFKYAEKHYNND
jgi:hypothetical protein